VAQRLPESAAQATQDRGTRKATSRRTCRGRPDSFAVARTDRRPTGVIEDAVCWTATSSTTGARLSHSSWLLCCRSDTEISNARRLMRTYARRQVTRSRGSRGCRPVLWLLQLAPSTGAVVGDDLLEHRGQGGGVDGVAFVEGNGS